MSKFAFHINLPVFFLQEGKAFIAYTPALDLSTAGHSLKQAEKRFGEAVQLFFEELVRMGTVGEVLRSLGWRKVKKEWRPPTLVKQKTERIRVAA